MKKIIAGLALSALLIFFSLRGVRLDGMVEGFGKIDYSYLFPVLSAMLVMQFLRSFRWGLILSPLAKVDQLSLFSVTSVGFLAIVAIPARLGELARPYLITKKSSLRMSSALGSIFVERVFDSLTVLVIASIVLSITPLPPWIARASLLFLLITIALLAMMIPLVIKPEPFLRTLAPLTGRLPARYAEGANRMIRQFSEGFRVMTDPALLAAVAGLSVIIWLIDVLAIYLLFLAFDLQLPVVAAFVLMVVLIIGIAVPTAPGFIGNWHYFCILGLSLFGVSKTDALTFAIIYHFLSIGIVIALGVVFLPFNRFSLADLRRQDGSPSS